MNARRNFIKGALSTLTFGLFEQRIMAEVRVSSPVDVRPKTVYGLKNRINIGSRHEPLIVAVSENKEWLNMAAIQFTLDYLLSNGIYITAAWLKHSEVNLTETQIVSALVKCGIKVERVQEVHSIAENIFYLRSLGKPDFATAKVFCESIGQTFYDLVEVDIDSIHLVKGDVFVLDKNPEKERFYCLGHNCFAL